MFRPLLVAIFRWFVIQKFKNSKAVTRFLHLLVDTRATGCITQWLMTNLAEQFHDVTATKERWSLPVVLSARTHNRTDHGESVWPVLWSVTWSSLHESSSVSTAAISSHSWLVNCMSWARKRTIPTQRSWCQLLGIEGAALSPLRNPTAVFSVF
jgi:hypothetical protein